MAQRQNGGPAQSRSILSALAATDMLDVRSKLPAELLVAVLDYLPVADQMRVARTSRRLQEMVYDDTRWVSRLRSMGCWNEREARQRFDDARRQRRDQAKAANGGAAPSNDITIFDAATEDTRRKRAASELRDGFETMTLSGASHDAENNSRYLDVFKNARSIRGGARQEYGKVYGALAPFYYDLSKAKSHTDPIVFKAFRDPESQAQMLANLKRFARSDWASGAESREARLKSMMGIFENAVLREFEQGYEFWDVDGRMNKYAGVLYKLDGSKGGVNLFIQNHLIFNDRELSSNPLECLNGGATADDISLEPSRVFFAKLLAKVNDQDAVIARIFPNAEEVFWEFVDKIREDIIVEYVAPLFDECHERGPEPYLKAFSGVFEQATHFYKSLRPSAEDTDLVIEKSKELCFKTFEPHMDLYLQEELEYFTKKSEEQVSQWEKKLSEQDLSLESFYMSNINRSAEKKDFLSSFKAVVMMPVAALPSFSAKPAASTSNGSGDTPTAPRSNSPGAAIPGDETLERKAPTDELAAKAAIMASKLEGIKSLCSIEVALSLVHLAQTSLGRVILLVPLGGQIGGEAKEQCASLFVVLLRILGERHVRTGFDTAVHHLSNYNPRDVNKHDKNGVAPLVTFIELVNVGDLISQMVDVFYEQQLAAPKLVDKNDFLDQAGMAKKKFEQMLDESVAAGLNKGIDVLMDEVEYLNATLQLPTDYNPAPTVDKRGTLVVNIDIGPTDTATRIVELVSSHTNMLVGTTDKSMLDVFNGEVGQRLFTAICKHLKRQRVSVDGAIRVIADMNHYSDYARTLKNQELLPYFTALRELSQIYLIDAAHAKEMATVIADGDRFSGVFRAEEVYEFAQRRADWYQVKKSVERAMYGMDCCIM